MKRIWRAFKDWMIKFALRGLARLDLEKAKHKIEEILKGLK